MKLSGLLVSHQDGKRLGRLQRGAGVAGNSSLGVRRLRRGVGFPHIVETWSVTSNKWTQPADAGKERQTN